MNSIRQISDRLNWRYVILGVIIWWLAMLIAYSILSLHVNHLKNSLRNAGIELTHEFAKRVSLPLLERDSQSIHKLLTEAASRPGVFYASVVDHRNKVVAFTGTGHLMPDMTTQTSAAEMVSVQEGGFNSHSRIINFVSSITYAGTKIGEIFIGLSAPGAIQSRKVFGIIAVISGLLLTGLVVLFRYASIRSAFVKVLPSSPSSTQIGTGAQGASIACPLCGNHQPLSAAIFKQSNIDPLLTNKTKTATANTSVVADNPEKSEPNLTDPVDVSGLRRQIILRCTEIIKKLTV
ncbi:MAG: hypothetical protein R3274_07950 [Desulfobacterales bacterium]|nr:hypothetical protein [Desulfobacterales bacterium]